MIIKYKPYFYTFSATLLVLSVFVLAYWGLPLGIDFEGGAVLEIEGITNPESIQPAVDEVADSFKIQSIGEGAYSIRMEEIDAPTKKSLIEALEQDNPDLVQLRFESIGPIIGSEITNDSIYAIVAVSLAILAYIAFAFRKLSFPLASWQYGVVTLITLCHDILITFGVVAVFVHFTGQDIGVPFVAALLTVLGYSVNDTIVVFDRVRENMRKAMGQSDFAKVVDTSTRETVVRSLNSSLTTLLVLVAILLFGGESLALFMVALITGVAIGTYSSLAIASPLVIDWVVLRQRVKKGLTKI